MKETSVQHRTSTPLLALLALGVVFGDIGTSPIYAFQQSVSDGQASVAGIYGTVSLIFWALVIVVSVKYLIFVLQADNHGEGGILALFALQPRSVREPKKKLNHVLYLALILGAAFLFGDGILTPSISVLSAVEGTGVINPGWVHYEVPITVVILIVLFGAQFAGTARIGSFFGPVMVVWFATIGYLGIPQIMHEPGVLKALSPTYAITYVGDNGFRTFIILSSVILAITGVEALYADLGHFGKRPIRLAWFLLAGPCLLLDYLGQAAEEIHTPKKANALFFNLAPNRGALIYLVIISTAATVIASQALISGVGSIAKQAVQMGIFPRMRVIHTNAMSSGQIYVPLINTLVGLGSVTLVLVFRTSGHLANAYSFDISGTMLITTVGMAVVARSRWKWHPAAVGLFVAFFGSIDLAFFLSTSTKIFKGAWVPLMISLAILYLILVWRRGQRVLVAQLSELELTWSDVEEQVAEGTLAEVPSTAIFLSSQLAKVPTAAVAQLRQMHVVQRHIVQALLTTTDEPWGRSVTRDEQVNDRVRLVEFAVGYLEEINVPELVSAYVLGPEEEAIATYCLADFNFSNRGSGQIRGVTEKVFSFMHRNSAPPLRFFGLPDDRVITLAVQSDL